MTCRGAGTDKAPVQFRVPRVIVTTRSESRGVGRQVRIDGKVQKLSREAAELYWKPRTRANQAASAAVRQSSIISGREEHLEKTRHIERIYRSKPIPCPDSWGGYSLVPEKIEFWEGKLDWLHDRERHILNNGGWTKVQLAP